MLVITKGARAASKIDLLTNVLDHHGLELDSLLAFAVSGWIKSERAQAGMLIITQLAP